jgi:hypothetical protein
MSRSGYVIAAFAAALLIGACGDATEEAAQDTNATPVSSAPTTATTPASGSLVATPITADTQETTVTPSPDVDPSLQGLVDQAVADLATHLSVDASTISVISAKSVTWPDGSVGCPQPGMMYTQVTVDGALVQLGVAGTTYSYHSGGSRSQFLCQKT